MTTELVLLLGLFAFITAGAFFGDNGPLKVFDRSGPRLAARIEQNIAVGHEFKVKGGAKESWQRPNAPPPDGRLK